MLHSTVKRDRAYHEAERHAPTREVAHGRREAARNGYRQRASEHVSIRSATAQSGQMLSAAKISIKGTRGRLTRPGAAPLVVPTVFGEPRSLAAARATIARLRAEVARITAELAAARPRWADETDCAHEYERVPPTYPPDNGEHNYPRCAPCAPCAGDYGAAAGHVLPADASDDAWPAAAARHDDRVRQPFWSTY